MDGQIRKSRIKLSTHIDKDSDEIITNLRQQSAGSQPAQERLKRLQTHLKQVNGKRVDKERLVAKKSSRNSGNSSWTSLNSSRSSSHSTSVSPDISVRCHTPRRASGTPAYIPKQTSGFLASLKNFCFPEKAKPVQPEVKPHLPSAAAALPATSSRKCRAIAASYTSSSAHSGAKNTWAKPKALLDASNRLDKTRSLSANQRLALLRESLQQQQLLQQKETNNNNNANKTTTKTLPNTKSPAISAQRIAKTSPAGFQSNDDVEPMDIDWQEEEGALARSSTSSSEIVITNSQLEMSVNKSLNKLQPDHKSDKLLQRLLATEQDLPARRVDHMYFVLDTNVLMDNLVFVEDLCHLALGETNGSMLYIPYIVIKELDKLKERRDDNELKRTTAMRAIRYLNSKFDNSLKIQGQSALEEAEHLIEVDCPDDSIVNCCLQLQAQVPHLMLLTNDNNLRLKANASAIQVSCRSDLMNDYRSEFDALPT